LAAPLHQELGGWGAGIDANVTYQMLMLLKQVGRGNLAVGRIYEGHVNALQLIQTFGTREQIAHCTHDTRDRHKIFGVWNAEASDGVKIVPLDSGRYRLEGSKTFCSSDGTHYPGFDPLLASTRLRCGISKCWRVCPKPK